jgi:hypothetical protein
MFVCFISDFGVDQVFNPVVHMFIAQFSGILNARGEAYGIGQNWGIPSVSVKVAPNHCLFW